MAEAEPTTWQWVELVVGGGVAPIFTGVSVGVAVGWIERMARRQEAVRDAFGHRNTGSPQLFGALMSRTARS